MKTRKRVTLGAAVFLGLIGSSALAQHKDPPSKKEAVSASRESDAAVHAGSAPVDDDILTAEPSDVNLGTLSVETSPPGATVLARARDSESEDKVLGVTPLETSRKPGVYILTIEKEGFEQITAQVRILAEENSRIQLLMETVDHGRRVRTILGHCLLWPGLGATLAGVTMIEIDPHGKIGVGGAVTAGVGAAVLASGAVLLGLAYRPPRVYMPATSTLALAPTRNGIALGYNRAF